MTNKEQFITNRMEEDSRVDRELAEQMWEAYKGTCSYQCILLGEVFGKFFTAIADDFKITWAVNKLEKFLNNLH